MKVAIGSDHAGYLLKKQLFPLLTELDGIEFQDFGTNGEASVDYPDYARKVAEAVIRKEADLGILLCGTGLGMAISANKVRGIRAVTAHDTFSAKMSRLHNNANILTLGERVIGPGLALDVITTWLSTEFAGGRHARRVDEMTAIEDEYCGSGPVMQE
jgi:ribose 5-phosphate isomerase B